MASAAAMASGWQRIAASSACGQPAVGVIRRMSALGQPACLGQPARRRVEQGVWPSPLSAVDNQPSAHSPNVSRSLPVVVLRPRNVSCSRQPVGSSGGRLSRANTKPSAADRRQVVPGRHAAEHDGSRGRTYGRPRRVSHSPRRIDMTWPSVNWPCSYRSWRSVPSWTKPAFS